MGAQAGGRAGAQRPHGRVEAAGAAASRQPPGTRRGAARARAAGPAPTLLPARATALGRWGRPGGRGAGGAGAGAAGQGWTAPRRAAPWGGSMRKNTARRDRNRLGCASNCGPDGGRVGSSARVSLTTQLPRPLHSRRGRERRCRPCRFLSATAPTPHATATSAPHMAWHTRRTEPRAARCLPARRAAAAQRRPLSQARAGRRSGLAAKRL
jgi:hypothetical protein